MADSNGKGTPLLDELEKGQWPSFVSEIKSMAEDNKMCQDLLQQLEKSYRDKKGYWKHGGIVGVMGYGEASSEGTPSLPRNTPMWPTSIPCGSTNPPAGSTHRRPSERSATSGRSAVPA